MIHLLPIRLSVLLIMLLTASIALALSDVDFFLRNMAYFVRWVLPASLCVVIVPCVAWRWIPPLQRVICPYLGGEWEGTLDYTGDRGSGHRSVKMDIRHSLYRIRIKLDSNESTSNTLATYLERDTGIRRHRLYYIYRNERKEGLVNAGDAYRGLAILGVTSGRLELRGNYFTERKNTGTLALKRRRAHPWWIPLR